MFFFLFFATLTQASSCLDAGVVEEIRNEVSLQILNPDLCDEKRDSHKLLSALVFLKTHSLPRVKGPLDKNFLPEDAWSFLRARVSSVINEPSCALGQMAFVRSHQPGVVHLCPSFYDPNLTIVERLPTLLHEAHHFDGDHFSHVNCKQGRLNGMRNACDPSLDYGGGYGVEVEALVRLSQVKELPPALRARARGMALTRAAENFNEPVAPYKLETIYLLGKGGRGYLLNPENGSLVGVPGLGQSVKLISRGPNLAAIPRDGGDAFLVDALSGFRALPVEGEVLIAYNNLPRAERPELVAILNEEKFAGSITSRTLSVAFGDNPYEIEADLSFRATAVYTPGEFGSSDSDTLYLIDDTNIVHPIRLMSGRRHEILPAQPFPPGFRAFTLFQGKRYALRANGTLAVEEGGNWVDVPGAKGESFSFVSRAFYWAPFLAD